MTAWESLIILMTEVQIFLNKTWSCSSLSTPHPNNRHQLEPWTLQCQPFYTFYTYSVRPRQRNSQGIVFQLRFLALSFSSFSYCLTQIKEKLLKESYIWEKRQKGPSNLMGGGNGKLSISTLISSRLLKSLLFIVTSRHPHKEGPTQL